MDIRRQAVALLSYDDWANRKILEAAAALTDDEFTRDRGPIVPGIRSNLQHMVSAQAAWLARVGGPPGDLAIETRDDLRKAFLHVHAEWLDVVDRMAQDGWTRAFGQILVKALPPAPGEIDLGGHRRRRDDQRGEHHRDVNPWHAVSTSPAGWAAAGI